MSGAKLLAFGIVAAHFGLGASVTLANDTTAELAIGGLRFTRTEAISMDREDLTISLERVQVRYSFSNATGKPQTVTVAFPLPDIDLANGENIALPTDDPVNFVGFETKIDGKLVPFTIDQKALVGTRDVTPLLTRLKLPLLPLGAREMRAADLPADTRKELVSEGLLMPVGTDERGRQQYAPAWSVKTSAVRTQTFPAARSVVVEHHYRPSIGISFDTILRQPLRQDKAMKPEFERLRKQHCITDSFLADLDKLVQATGANANSLQTRSINYVLKTGANWAGPIKTFRLTIDKGAPDRLVSFCKGPLTAVSNNGLEWEAKDFTPDFDLRILIVGKF